MKKFKNIKKKFIDNIWIKIKSWWVKINVYVIFVNIMFMLNFLKWNLILYRGFSFNLVDLRIIVSYL